MLVHTYFMVTIHASVGKPDYTEGSDQDHLQEKEMQKGKMVV